MVKTMLYLVIVLLTFALVLLATIYLLQERLIFFPEKLPRSYTFSFTYPAEEVFLPPAGNAECHALYFKASNSKGTVLYFHGNAGSLKNWGFVAEHFLKRGYSVFMPDYRGYGKSTGKLSEKLLHQDALAAWRYVQEKTSGGDVIIYGRSLGAGIAVQLAAAQTPKALVLESPFNNLVEVARAHFPYLPARLLLRYSFRSDKVIGNVKCPVYILHGTHDEVIPFASAQKLAATAGSKARFIVLEGGSHNNLASFPEYDILLDEVFK